MATQRRQESKWWFECQRTRFLQRSQSWQTGVEAATAGGRIEEEVILCPDDGDEEEVNLSQDRE